MGMCIEYCVLSIVYMSIESVYVSKLSDTLGTLRYTLILVHTGMGRTLFFYIFPYFSMFFH